MNDAQKHDYLNLWSTVLLTFLGIGLTLCLSTVKPKYLNPASTDFQVSHIIIFISVIWVFASIIHFLSSFILSIKYEQSRQKLGLNMISIFLCISLICLLGSIFDFNSSIYCIYISIILLIATICFVITDIEDEMKTIGYILFLLTWLLLVPGLVLRLGSI